MKNGKYTREFRDSTVQLVVNGRAYESIFS